MCYESYFLTGDDYNKLKIVLEEMSDQTIEITNEKIAYYYVYEYCKQNETKVNESKKITIWSVCNNHYFQKNLKRNLRI